MATALIQQLEDDRRRIRREVLLWNVLHALRGTMQVWGETPDVDVKAVRVEMTDASARAIAPLVEAVQILEEIIWASDGCMGHRDCVHSMEPWQRARALLEGKWEAETSCGELTWPPAARPPEEP